jgi:hypothetical protein
MKVVTQRPNRYSHESFYADSIIRETEKAFLIKINDDFWGEVQKWIPKSKVLILEGKKEYFIPSFFVKLAEPPEIYNTAYRSEKIYKAEHEEVLYRREKLDAI